MRVLFTLLVFISFSLRSQNHKLYRLNNDSVFLNSTERKLILIYFTDRSCFDCFISINDYLKSDTNAYYFFAIEKTNSAMNNYNIYTRLVNNGVSKEHVLFTKTHSHEISPFLKIYHKKNISVIPYSEIFTDKKTLQLSEKLKKMLKSD
jgi:hypothetical protein